MSGKGSTARSEARTYGNWRKPTSPGIFGIGLAGTLLLFGGSLLVIGALFISVLVALSLAVLVGVTIAPLLIRDQHGRNGMQWLAAKGSWTLGVLQGRHFYRSGPFGRTPETTSRLPGLGASLRVSEFVDGHGRPFAILTSPGRWHHTIVLDCHADGASLVDSEQVDTWVAYWGDWLAQLGHEPGLVAASVTIEAAPDSGDRLTREVAENMHPDAPPLAREVLAEIVRDYPLGSATLASRVALTYSGTARNTGARRDLEAVAETLATRLPGLANDLQMTGAGPAVPMTARDLGLMVRLAFDPASVTLVDGAPDDVPWHEVGPVGTLETADAYRHDSAWSMTWAMSDAPRGEVFSTVLNRLVMPHPDILRKRVTLVYRPHDVGTSARLVERDRKDALFKAKQAKIAQARDSIAVQAADRAAQEEATGAGLIRFGIYVTATVADADDLNLAASAIDNLAAASRLRLRRVRFGQASAFLAALPLGLVMPLHLRVPQAVRDAM